MSSLFEIFYSRVPDGKAIGTGIKPTIRKWQEALPNITENMVEQLSSVLPTVFGDYPFGGDDLVPSIILCALFVIIGSVHLFYFAKNYQRGHNFYLSFGLVFGCYIRAGAFACRAKWAVNALALNSAIASVLLGFFATIILDFLNLILAHRIFTWRHPETGASSVFNIFMYLFYMCVGGMVVMAVLAKYIPFLGYMTPTLFTNFKRLTKGCSVFIVIYSFGGIVILATAFLIPPGVIRGQFGKFYAQRNRESHELPPTFAPYWIESFSPTYFVKKGSQQIIYKDDSVLTKCVRVIPSSNPPASGRATRQNPHDKGGPPVHIAIALVVITTLLLTVESAFWCASGMKFEFVGSEDPSVGVPECSFIFKNAIMYVSFGAIEFVVHCVYLLGRIDLRFYIPDMARRRHSNGRYVSQEAHKEGYSDPDQLSDANLIDEEARLREHNNI